MIGAMQHVAKVLACLDPDSASAEEWDELLHAQGVHLYTSQGFDRVCDGRGPASCFFPVAVHPQEAMERAVTAGILPAEVIDGGRHFFNTPSEPYCTCSTLMDVDLLCHTVECRLMKRTRMAYVKGRGPVSEAQVFSFLMRAPEMLAADRFVSNWRQILWCPRGSSVDRDRAAATPLRDMGLWARPLGAEMVAVGLLPVSFSSLDPGPYTALEIGRRMHEAAQAELAARPTFS